MASKDMLVDFNQINDFNPFTPGEASHLPGTSNADFRFVNAPGLPEPPAQWEGENSDGACVGGEVRLGCNAPPHCPVKRNALPSYNIEQGRWSLSGGKCAHKRETGSLMDAKGLVTILALVAFIYYLNRE